MGAPTAPGRETYIGSWRGHINAARQIVDNRLGSALIMEDDMDWDVRIKSQLVQFAQGTRQLLNTPAGSTPHSPYGDDWDVLWIGHCGETTFPKDDERKYVISNDYSVPSFKSLDTVNDEIKKHPEHSRFIHDVKGTICSFAYALSYKGAQKLILGLALQEWKGNFDNALSNGFCNNFPSIKPTCLTVQPAYMFHHRQAGSMKADSDTESGGQNGEVRAQAYTPNMRYSVRLNLEGILRGDTQLSDQWPDDKVRPAR